MPKDKKTRLAKSAFEILNELMGQLHAGRKVACIAIREPNILKSKYTKYFVQIGIGAICLALRKFDDLWVNQIKSILLPNDLPRAGIELHNVIDKKAIRKFCNIVIAHYSTRKDGMKTAEEKIENLLIKQGFKSDEEFLDWTKNVVTKVEIVRNYISEKYGLEKRENIEETMRSGLDIEQPHGETIGEG